MPRFKEGDSVIIRKISATGKIERIIPHPYLPDWLIKPNYIVHLDMNGSEVFREKDLEKV